MLGAGLMLSCANGTEVLVLDLPRRHQLRKQHLVFSLLLPRFWAGLTKAQGSPQQSVQSHVANHWLILVTK